MKEIRHFLLHEKCDQHVQEMLEMRGIRHQVKRRSVLTFFMGKCTEIHLMD